MITDDQQIYACSFIASELSRVYHQFYFAECLYSSSASAFFDRRLALFSPGHKNGEQWFIKFVALIDLVIQAVVRVVRTMMPMLSKLIIRGAQNLSARRFCE